MLACRGCRQAARARVPTAALQGFVSLLLTTFTNPLNKVCGEVPDGRAAEPPSVAGELWWPPPPPPAMRPHAATEPCLPVNCRCRSALLLVDGRLDHAVQVRAWRWAPAALRTACRQPCLARRALLDRRWKRRTASHPRPLQRRGLPLLPPGHRGHQPVRRGERGRVRRASECVRTPACPLLPASPLPLTRRLLPAPSSSSHVFMDADGPRMHVEQHQPGALLRVRHHRLAG